jgi:hypothetical protein
MKKLITTLAVCLTVGVGASAMPQQQQQPPPPPPNPQTQQTQPQKPATQELVLTGCLIQGTGPTVFIFDNAKKDPKSQTEKAMKYVVIASAEDLNLRQHLNHEVQIVGTWDGKTAPATPKVEEKDLPRLTAKSLTMISNTCAVVTR